MAKIITVTTSQAETAVDFGAYYQFVWVKNLSDDTDCYISDHSGASAEDDDVTLVSAGSSAMIATSGDTIYIIGSGVKCECRAQNFAECPFGDLAGESGGGSITIDPTPTQGSSNAVSSGGVYTALQNVPQPVDYSTTEQDTGRKWIDGKPIYQISTLVTSTELFDASALSIDKLIKVEALGSDGAGYTSNRWTIESMSGISNVQIFWQSSLDKIVYNNQYPLYAATIWYTKTTDTAAE